jgi:hypothetical protein
VNDESLCGKIEEILNKIIHAQILPILASTADQTVETREVQRQVLRELKGLRGKLDTLESDFEALREEHNQCPHCGIAVAVG